MPEKISGNMLQENTPDRQDENTEKKVNSLLIVCTFIASFMVAFVLWFIFFGSKIQQVQTLGQQFVPQIITRIATPTQIPKSTISGTIVVEGYTSPDMYLTLSERTGTGNFTEVITGLVPGSSTTFSWPDAIHGTNYEMKVSLKVKGVTIQESSTVSVSAPATGVALVIVSLQKPPVTSASTISGTVHVDGYIPTGATMDIVSEASGAATFTTVVPSLSPTDNVSWSWSNATSSATYQLKAEIKTATGTIISNATPKTVTAPSTGQILTVSSNGVPTTPTVTTLSGTITINGDIPTNSYITLATRQSGTGTFNQVTGNLTATNGVSWKWGNAQTGTKYDLQAYLWVNGKPFTQSDISTVTAPSSSSVVTINAQQGLQAPGVATISVACNGEQSSNWQATITYNINATIQDAKQFQVVVSQATQGNQVINTTLTPGNPNTAQTLTSGYQFINGTTYFAQYGYTLDGTTFSPLSPSVQFSCQ